MPSRPTPIPRSSERVRSQLSEASARFAPPPRGSGAADARPAAVLILFSPRPGSDSDAHDDPTPSASELYPADLDVLLQVRSAALREHAGQVSFPGGRRDDHDEDAVATALREASEETGLDSASVEVLSALPPLPLPVSNHLVTPVIAWWATPTALAAVDAAETTLVWQASVGRLLDPRSRFTSVLSRGGQTFRGPAFDADGTIVWGFTAMVLDALFDATGWANPWDRARERPVTP